MPLISASFHSPLRANINSSPCWLPFPRVALPRICLHPLSTSSNDWIFGLMLPPGRFRGLVVNFSNIPQLLLDWEASPEDFVEKHFPGDLRRIAAEGTVAVSFDAMGL